MNSVFFKLEKPPENTPCNGCGYCCAVSPCKLAEMVLKCTTGPCVALEQDGNRTACGLVRNPLGYIFKAAHPESTEDVISTVPDSEVGRQLSRDMAKALGVGKGCDSADDEDSVHWPPRN